MSRILLTGASGFIGTHVRTALYEAGHQVLSLMRAPSGTPHPGERFLRGTLAEIPALEQRLSGAPVDACVHLAWEGIPDYGSECSMNNLEYGFQVLRLCRRLGVQKLVFSGSCWEYADPAGMVSEDAPLSYENPFKTAKNTLHAMAEAFCREYGISCCWLRLFYVYGEGQRPGSLLPYVVRELAGGRQPALGGAFNQNDFVHVSDVARAVCRSVASIPTTPSCETYNIGSGKAVRVLDLAAAAARLLRADFEPALYAPPAERPAAFWADVHAAERQLHWKPQVSLEEGLARFIRFTEAKEAI